MNIVVLGAGGHARSVCDVLLAGGEHRIIGLVDGQATQGFFSLPLLGGDEILALLRQEERAQGAFVAIGSNAVRKKLYSRLRELGFYMVSAISPNAHVSPYATVGPGTAVMNGVVIGPCARVGEGCIINTNASIDHDDEIGDYSHIAPGAALSGGVIVGAGAFLGTGCRVIDGIHIGKDVILGAGATAIRDLPDGVTAVGVPARIIKDKGEAR